MIYKIKKTDIKQCTRCMYEIPLVIRKKNEKKEKTEKKGENLKYDLS